MTDPIDPVRLALLDDSAFERIVPVPGEPLGYGVDLAGIEDSDETFSELDPESPVGIWQALVHRWSTPRGKLDDDPEYGRDLVAMLNVGIEQKDLQALGGQLAAEGEKDDRVQSLSVEVIAITAERYEIRVLITPERPSLKPFERVLAVESGEILTEALER